MAFNAIDNTRVNAAKHPDDWYADEVVAGKEQPYASLAVAYSKIPSAVRMKGRPFLVTINGLTEEYWWKDDLTTAIPKGGIQGEVNLLTTTTAIRAFSGDLKSKYFTTTDIAGDWYYDPTDTTSLDNLGTILVTADGKRIKRYITTHINVNWFGTVGDGIINDRPAFQKAVDYCIAAIISTQKPLSLYAPKNTYNFNSSTGVAIPGYGTVPVGIALPVGLPAMFTLLTDGLETVIKLNTTCANVFYINRIADYDTFQNITLNGFTCDNNNVAGRCHIVLGSIPASNTVQKRLNFKNIFIRGGVTKNIPIDYTQSTTIKGSFAFVGQHLGAMEATRTTSENVIIKDWDQYEGSYHSQVTSYVTAGNGATNHYYNNIYFHNCKHVIAVPHAETLQQTSFFITGSGVGDNGAIIDCFSQNIGDDGIELGPMQNFLIRNFHAVNPYFEAILFRHSQPPIDINSQKVIIENLVVQGKADLGAIGVFAFATPARWQTDNGAQFGNYVFTDTNFSNDGFRRTLSTRSYFFLNTSEAVVKSIEYRGVKIAITNYSFDNTPLVLEYNIFEINPTVAGTQVVVKDLEIYVSSTATALTGSLLNIFKVDGTNPNLDVDDCRYDFSGIISTTVTSNFAPIAKTSGTSINVTFTNIYAIKLQPQGSQFGLLLYSAGVIQRVALYASNFKNGVRGGGVDISLTNSNTFNTSVLYVAPDNKFTGAQGRVFVTANYTATALTDRVSVVTRAIPISITYPVPNRLFSDRPYSVKDEAGLADQYPITIIHEGLKFKVFRSV